MSKTQPTYTVPLTEMGRIERLAEEMFGEQLDRVPGTTDTNSMDRFHVVVKRFHSSFHERVAEEGYRLGWIAPERETPFSEFDGPGMRIEVIRDDE